MRLRRFLVLIALVIGGAGCSEDARRFDDVQQMSALLQDKDLGCEELKQANIEAEGEGPPTSSGVCAVEGESVQLFVFGTDSDAALWFERGRMETRPTARGANWVGVPESQEVAEQVATAFGE